MPTTDDIQQQIDDLSSRADESDSSLQDFSDSLDTNLSDIQTTLDDNASTLDDLKTNEGQLTYPLNQDTIDLITEQTPTMMQYMANNGYIGSVALVGGTKTVTSNLITSTSMVLVSRSVTGGTAGHLSTAVTAGQVIITSSSGTDTSTVIYFIIN